MCKAVDKEMEIGGIRLISKTKQSLAGGAAGNG
jgi:molybdenum cofactor biosynthesis enzyme